MAEPVDLADLDRELREHIEYGPNCTVTPEALSALVACARALMRVKDEPSIGELERWRIAFDALRGVTDTARKEA